MKWKFLTWLPKPWARSLKRPRGELEGFLRGAVLVHLFFNTSLELGHYAGWQRAFPPDKSDLNLAGKKNLLLPQTGIAQIRDIKERMAARWGRRLRATADRPDGIYVGA